MQNRGPITDRSSTITAGGTSQEVVAKTPNRNYLMFQNTSNTDMWINFGKSAVADSPSILVGANGGVCTWDAGYIPTDDLQVYCATSGKAFTCKEA